VKQLLLLAQQRSRGKRREGGGGSGDRGSPGDARWGVKVLFARRRAEAGLCWGGGLGRISRGIVPKGRQALLPHRSLTPISEATGLGRDVCGRPRGGETVVRLPHDIRRGSSEDVLARLGSPEPAGVAENDGR